jgi:hypothetical protein
LFIRTETLDTRQEDKPVLRLDGRMLDDGFGNPAGLALEIGLVPTRLRLF